MYTLTHRHVSNRKCISPYNPPRNMVKNISQRDTTNTTLLLPLINGHERPTKIFSKEIVLYCTASSTPKFLLTFLLLQIKFLS